MQEGELSFALAASMADGTLLFFPGQKLLNSIQHLQQAGCKTLLVGMPVEKVHCPMAVIKKPGMADANVEGPSET